MVLESEIYLIFTIYKIFYLYFFISKKKLSITNLTLDWLGAAIMAMAVWNPRIFKSWDDIHKKSSNIKNKKIRGKNKIVKILDNVYP